MLNKINNKICIITLVVLFFLVLMYQYKGEYELTEYMTIEELEKKSDIIKNDNDIQMKRIKEYHKTLDEIEKWSNDGVNFKEMECDYSSLLVINNMMEEILKIECILKTNRKIIQEWIEKFEKMMTGEEIGDEIFSSYLPEKYKNQRMKLTSDASLAEKRNDYIYIGDDEGKIIYHKLLSGWMIYNSRKSILSDRNLIRKIESNKEKLNEIKSKVCSGGVIGQI